MGRSKLMIQQNCLGKQFTWDERLKLQYLYCGTNGYKKERSPKNLGIIFAKSSKTIRRELKRGMVVHLTSELVEVEEYNADHAQHDAELRKGRCGPDLKLGHDMELAQAIARLILDYKYSPYSVVQYFNKNGWPSQTRCCEKTIYNWIENGAIPDVLPENLLRKGKMKKRGLGGPRKHSRLKNAERSIDKRPDNINSRMEFGHWEGDTLYSCSGGSLECLFTLTERKTRCEIVRKIPDRTAESVLNEVNRLEKQLGAVMFRNIFKSITFDNGAEFSNVLGLEKSIINKGKRTTLYFAHPYCSCERGTNENHNGIIRRFFPKGTDFKQVLKKEIRKVQNWMNSYPRKKLNGNSPIRALMEEMKNIGAIPVCLEVS